MLSATSICRGGPLESRHGPQSDGSDEGDSNMTEYHDSWYEQGSVHLCLCLISVIQVAPVNGALDIKLDR